jgi:hypothetical protein
MNSRLLDLLDGWLQGDVFSCMEYVDRYPIFAECYQVELDEIHINMIFLAIHSSFLLVAFPLYCQYKKKTLPPIGNIIVRARLSSIQDITKTRLD